MAGYEGAEEKELGWNTQVSFVFVQDGVDGLRCALLELELAVFIALYLDRGTHERHEAQACEGVVGCIG